MLNCKSHSFIEVRIMTIKNIPYKTAQSYIHTQQVTPIPG